MLNAIASENAQGGSVSKADSGYHTHIDKASDGEKYEGRVFSPKTKPWKGHVAGIDPHLEWLLECSESALGKRGTMGAVISQGESGTVGGTSRLDAAGSFVHGYTDQQIGLGGYGGDVERHRWLWAAWCLVSVRSRNVLLTYLAQPVAEFRSDAGYGARTKWVEGSDQATGEHPHSRTGVEARLGEFASLAFALAKDPSRLLLACREPDPMRKGKPMVEERKRRRRAVSDAIKAARSELDTAHREWISKKQDADPMRADRERRKIAKEHQPGVDAE